MYGIGEMVVYGAFGVMEIVGVTAEMLGNEPKKYYVMREYSSNTSSLTYVPIENAALVEQMKPLLTPEEIVSVVKKAKTSPPLDWIEDNRARSEFYKKLLSTSDRCMLLLMIDAVRKTGIRREAEGKKNYIADENSMHRAEKLIATEFSLVLGIPESEVADFIKNI